MKTTDELRAARQGRPLQLGPATGGAWLTDANGDLVENDVEEELAENEANFLEPIDLEAPYFQADALRAALSADLQPLGAALAGALQAGDEAAFQAALKKISKRMPEFLDSPALEALMASEFVKALTQEDTTDES